jgi:uncharacterized protein (TIGR03118 family)
MRPSTRDLQHTVLEGKHKRPSRERRPAVEGLEERALLSAAHDLAVHKHFAVPDHKSVSGYLQTNRVSDIAGQQAQISFVQTNLVSDVAGQRAQIIDPRLVDPWDVNFPQAPKLNPPVWVADQGTGVATMYQISSTGHTVKKLHSKVTIPTVGSSTPTGPTGVVMNAHPPNFKIPAPGRKSVPATYIFDTLQGTIEGWNPHSKGGKSSAEVVVNNSSTAEYTGLAAGAVGDQQYIYAANDIASPGIDVYNGSFQRVTTLPGNFVDPSLPTGFTPYGLRDLGKDLFVMYRGPEFIGGAVAEFNNDGTFMTQVASDTTPSGNLQSPWGAAQITRGFGEYDNDLLVGNFSTGQIDAYNLSSGEFEGNLLNTNGTPLTIPGLRSIHFGPGLGDFGEPKVALLFTAGLDVNTAGIDQVYHGLYGTITPSPPVIRS